MKSYIWGKKKGRISNDYGTKMHIHQAQIKSLPDGSGRSSSGTSWEWTNTNSLQVDSNKYNSIVNEILTDGDN